MLQRVVLLSAALSFITACGGGGGTGSSPLPPGSQNPGTVSSGVPDPKPTATATEAPVPSATPLLGGIALGQDNLVYVSSQKGLDQFTESLTLTSTATQSVIDTWPATPRNLLPSGGVTALANTINALATLKTTAASTGAATIIQPALVQFNTTTGTWATPGPIVDTTPGDTFNDFVKGEVQVAIIGNRASGTAFTGFIALLTGCAPAPFTFIMPAANVPLSVGAFDNNGVMWVATDLSRGSGTPSEIFAVATSGAVLRTVPLTPGAQVGGLVLGTDNAIWFTESGPGPANAIGRVASDGTVNIYPIKTGHGLAPAGITVGFDGALWFTELHGNKVGRMTTSGLLTEEVDVPTQKAEPKGIVGCPTGLPCTPLRAVFFTEKQKVGKVSF